MIVHVDREGREIGSENRIPKIALFVSFFKQYTEWPWVRWGVENQSGIADEYWLGIDDSRQDSPELGTLPWTVLRSPKEYDGKFSKGWLLNEVARRTDCNVMVCVDGDSVPSRDLLQTIRAIYSGELKEWGFTEHATGKPCNLRVSDPWRDLYTGARFYMHGQPESMSWESIAAATVTDRLQRRGFANGRAAFQAGISAFPKTAVDASTFPDEGRGVDARWWIRIRNEFDSRPMPDECFIAHFGERGDGGGNELSGRDLEYIRASRENEEPKQWYRAYRGFRHGKAAFQGGCAALAVAAALAFPFRHCRGEDAHFVQRASAAYTARPMPDWCCISHSGVRTGTGRRYEADLLPPGKRHGAE